MTYIYHYNEILWLIELCIGICWILWIAQHHLPTLINFLPLLPIAMNLHVTKTIPLWGHSIPCGDMLAVMYGLGLNIVAHKKGNKAANITLQRSLHAVLIWSVLTLAHTAFRPTPNEPLNAAHQLLFMQTPWICLVSWSTFYTTQAIERIIFSHLIKRYSFFFVNALSTFSSQTLDTILFTTIGLYFQNIEIRTVIAWSLFIKTLAWFISNIGVKLFYENKTSPRL